MKKWKNDKIIFMKVMINEWLFFVEEWRSGGGGDRVALFFISSSLNILVALSVED